MEPALSLLFVSRKTIKMFISWTVEASQDDSQDDSQAKENTEEKKIKTVRNFLDEYRKKMILGDNSPRTLITEGILRLCFYGCRGEKVDLRALYDLYKKLKNVSFSEC